MSALKHICWLRKLVLFRFFGLILLLLFGMSFVTIMFEHTGCMFEHTWGMFEHTLVYVQT